MDSVIKEITSQNNKLVYKVNQNSEVLKITFAFNREHELNNFNLNPGEVIARFEKLDELNQLLSLITNLLKNVSNNNRINININFNFVVNNKEEEERVKEVIGVLKQYRFNNCNIIPTQEYSQTKQIQNNQVNQQIIEEQKEMVAKGTKEIIKQGPNGEILKYVESDGKIYDNNFTLSINEQKQQLLANWRQDPAKYAEISRMTQEELDKELTRVVTSNQKQYDLSSTTQNNTQNNTQSNNQEQANIANEISRNEDGKVNTELGIVQNNVSNNNEFTVVEQTNNSFNIATPTTNQQTISSINGISTSTATSSNNTLNVANTNPTLGNEGINSRELINDIYYIDDYSNEIYNSNEELIGTIGERDGYYIDANNHLIKNNQIIGTIENIRDMKQTKSNAKKRVLQKPDGYITFLLFSIILSLAFVIYIVITLV